MSYREIAALQHRLIAGRKEVIKAMKNGDVSEVIIAEDAAQSVTSEVEKLAEALCIKCFKVDSKKKLGVACGIDVPTSTVAIEKV